MTHTLGKLYLKELESESAATRKCLERIPTELFAWKPHDKSMTMGVLATIVADVPNWIAMIVEKPDIDFATYPHANLKTTADLVSHFDRAMQAAKEALREVADTDLDQAFSLKNDGRVLFSQPKRDTISSTINHLAHHRGQLTVYMRMNDIPVPAIYGSSADEKAF